MGTTMLKLAVISAVMLVAFIATVPYRLDDLKKHEACRIKCENSYNEHWKHGCKQDCLKALENVK